MSYRTRGSQLNLLQQMAQDRQNAEDVDYFRELARDIPKDPTKESKLLPIIGDTVRNGHIFDIDFDENVSLSEEAVAEDEARLRLFEEYDRIKERLTITDELAWWWALQVVKYPLIDSYQTARVAQYHVLKKGDPVQAKREYLDFCKLFLLQQAAGLPEVREDVEEEALIYELFRDMNELTFGDIVDELDFPRFPDGRRDSLRTLARLPLKIYLTTSYFDFVERELVAEGKQPRSRFCFWNRIGPESVAPEHRPDPAYLPDAQHPVVYHLFGMETYPGSLVLTEDDHLTFLTRVARGDQDGQGTEIIPEYLLSELRESTLLLMGYRLQDWDFRTLFHALLNPKRRFTVPRERKSVALQLELKQALVADKEKAGEYLGEYFEGANFKIQWKDPDDFVERLWEAWQD